MNQYFMNVLIATNMNYVALLQILINFINFKFVFINIIVSYDLE